MSLDVMLVEDDENLLEVIESLAQRSGYKVHKCKDLDQARSFLDNLVPDIVICDFFLGKKNAAELFDYLRFQLNMNTPFILMTGYPLTSEMDKVLRDKNTILLKKPFLKADLERAIGKIKK